MLSDPAVWGPLLIAATVAITVLWILRAIEAADTSRHADHRETMEVLNSLPDELDQIKSQLGYIDKNTTKGGR